MRNPDFFLLAGERRSLPRDVTKAYRIGLSLPRSELGASVPGIFGSRIAAAAVRQPSLHRVIFPRAGWVGRTAVVPPATESLCTCKDLPLSASKGLMRRSKVEHYSITSSARASSAGGMVSPSAFAVLRLMTSSNLVGCSTGKSAGLAPLRILSTYVAARRQTSKKLGA